MSTCFPFKLYHIRYFFTVRDNDMRLCFLQWVCLHSWSWIRRSHKSFLFSTQCLSPFFLAPPILIKSDVNLCDCNDSFAVSANTYLLVKHGVQKKWNIASTIKKQKISTQKIVYYCVYILILHYWDTEILLLFLTTKYP